MLQLVNIPFTIDTFKRYFRKMVIQTTSLIDVLSSSLTEFAFFKKPLRLVLASLGIISLQTRTKLQKFIKGVLSYFKLQVIFQS